MCSGFEQFKGKKENKNQENFTVSDKKRLDSVETSIQNQNGFSVLTDQTSNNVQPNQTQEPAGIESVFREDYGFVDNAMNRNLVHNGSLVIGSVSDQAPEIHRPARSVNIHINDSLYQRRPDDINADLIKNNTDTIQALKKRSGVLKGSLDDKWGEKLFYVDGRSFFEDNIKRVVSRFGAITEPNQQHTFDEDLPHQNIAGMFNEEMHSEDTIDCLYVDGIPMRQFVKEHYHYKRDDSTADITMEIYASLIFAEGKHHMNIVKPVVRNGIPDVIISDLSVPMDPKEQARRDKGVAKKKAEARKILAGKKNELILKGNIAYRKACGVNIEPLSHIESLKAQIDSAGKGDSKAFKDFSGKFDRYFNAIEQTVRGTTERTMGIDAVTSLKARCMEALSACDTYMKRGINKKNAQRQEAAKQIYARLSRDIALMNLNLKRFSNANGGLNKEITISELLNDTKELDAWEIPSVPAYINNAVSPLDTGLVDERTIQENTDMFKMLRKVSNESTGDPVREDYENDGSLFSVQSVQFFVKFIRQQLRGLFSTVDPSSQQDNSSDKLTQQIASRFNKELQLQEAEDCLYVDGIPLRKFLEERYHIPFQFDDQRAYMFMEMYATMLMADGKHRVNFVVPVIRDGKADVLISDINLPISEEEKSLLSNMLSGKKAEVEGRLDKVKEELMIKSNIAYRHACGMNIEPLTQLENLNKQLEKSKISDNLAGKAFSEAFRNYFRAMENQVEGLNEKQMDSVSVRALKEMCAQLLSACNAYLQSGRSEENVPGADTADQINKMVSSHLKMLKQSLAKLSGKDNPDNGITISEILNSGGK